MMGGLARVARAAAPIGLVATALVWLPRPAAAGFMGGARSSATYTTAVLAAPTGLVGSVSGGTVTLTWAPAASPVAGTEVQRAGSPAGPYAPIGLVAAPAANFTDSPGPGVWYYTVESFREGWTSPAVGPVTAAVPGWRGQVASGSSPSGGQSLSLVTTTAVAAGDVLAVRTAAGSTAPVASVTDSAGDTYLLQAAASEHRSMTAEVWTATTKSALPAGSSILVTWSQTVGARVAATADDFTGVTAGADGSATATGRGTTPSATTKCTTGDLVVAVTATTAQPPGGYSEAAGWTTLPSVDLTGQGSNALGLYGGWRIAASPAVTHDPTLSVSSGWVEADVALPAG